MNKAFLDRIIEKELFFQIQRKEKEEKEEDNLIKRFFKKIKKKDN